MTESMPFFLSKEGRSGYGGITKGHYDQTGKCCPKYYVNEPKAWEQFKLGVAKARKEPVCQTVEMVLNGEAKAVQGMKIEGVYFVKLRDLVDGQIVVSYDPITRRLSLEV